MSLSKKHILSDMLTFTRNPTTYLNEIWQSYFADVPRVNTLEIAYGQPWKRRLGLIRLSLDNTISFIGVNALLQIPQIPEYILITTVAHELTHYAHGFGSPLPRQYRHPHANNVVKDELERRGLGETMRLCDEWIDNEWFSFYDKQREMDWAELPAAYRPTRVQRKSQV
ncbi:MAG: hypothetical protein ABI234_05600 [Ktedonobacteraceae bacterium]